MNSHNTATAGLLAALVFAIVFLLFGAVRGAVAHEAPSGMPYPTDCCDNKGRECAPIDHRYVRQTPQGYLVTIPGGEHPNVHEGETASRIFPYGVSTIRHSTDGEYHACVGQRWQTQTRQHVPIYCIIVPPQSF